MFAAEVAPTDGSDTLSDISTLTQADQTIYYAVHQMCNEDYSPNDEYTILNFWLSGILLNVIGMIGAVGNIISITILSRPQMRSSINYLLIGLACCDTVLIITSMILFGFRSIYPYTGFMLQYNYFVYPHMAQYVFPLATASQTASIYLTVMVSLERYVAVCHPLRAVGVIYNHFLVYIKFLSSRGTSSFMKLLFDIL